MNTHDPQHRVPLLNEAGRRRLEWLQEHPHAPRFNHVGVDRLSEAGLQRVTAFEASLENEPPAWQPSSRPPWLAEFAAFCFREVPFYRRYGALPDGFADIPQCGRADLSREPWSFVPDSASLDGLIVFQTSGATGHPLDILTHPDTLAHYLPLLRRALAWHGVALAPPAAGDEPPRATVAVVAYQHTTYTYAAVLAYLNQAGFVKVNLNPTDWRDPDDRARYLDDCRPDVISGDPVSLAALAALPLRHRPRALVSTAMGLLPGLRHELETRFDCPVVDLYSMNETGPIAAAVGERYRLLQPRLYVEILDEDGAPCPPGTRGEVVVSGGFNPLLPLLRYRTGDYASLHFAGSQPLLADLEGRPPVVFVTADGRQINNIDVTARLKAFALPQFALHQAADGSLTLRLPEAYPNAEAVRAALLDLFGPTQPLTIAPLDVAAGKVLQYTREP